MVEVWTADELRRCYGPFYERGAGLHLDVRMVPETLWCLLPYAEFWGIADDVERENLVKAAPAEVRRNLKSVADAFERELDDWLAGPEADRPSLSEEFVAYCALGMAADSI